MNGKIWALAPVALAAVVAVAAAGAAGSKSYPDAAGDSGGAPDIVAVDVSNDDGGVLTFAFRFANRTALQGDDSMLIAIDADRNARSGGPAGAEYLIVADWGDRSYGMGRWDGSRYDWSTPQATLRTTDGMTFQVHRSEVGNAGGFDFFTIAFAGWNGERYADSDLAPEGSAAWTYELKLAPQLRSFTAGFAPAAPAAGKRFSLRGVRITLGDGKVVSAQGMRCTAKLAGKPLAPAGRCAWNVPATAKGKKLVVTATVTYGGATGTAGPFVFTVRQ